MVGDQNTYDELLADRWSTSDKVRVDFVRLQCAVASVGNNWAISGRGVRNADVFLEQFRGWESFLSPAVDFDLAATIVHSSEVGAGLGIAIDNYWDYVSGPALTVTAVGAFSLMHCPESIGDWRRELLAITSFYRRSGRRRLLSFIVG